MKKKSVFLSKVFAVALAASMAFSAPYASAAVVTENATYEGGKAVLTQSTAFWSAFSDFYRVSGDFDVTFEIANKSDQAENFDNVVIAFSSAVDYVEGAPNGIPGYKEYMVMRMDNWCWSPTEANVTTEFTEVVKECDWNWDTFKSVMADAKINLNIKRTGNDFAVTMVVDGADGNTYHQSYKFTTEADKDMNIFFTGEKADVSILSYTVNGAAAETPSTETPDTTTPETPAEDTTTPETPAEDTTTPETPAEDTTTPETPAEDTTTPETPAEPEDTTTAPAEDEEPAEEETVKAAAKLNKKKATVKVGKSVKLKVQNTTKKVTWSSSNKKVAKVNKSGKVTGVKAGKAVIKAKVGGKTLKCNVTVK